MLRSMTGFGRAEGVVKNRKVTVEIRSLNSKQFDLVMKLSGAYREKDAELRHWFGDRVVRGKCEVYIGSELLITERSTSFDHALIKAYHEELSGLARSLDPNSATDLLSFILRLPDVTTTAREELEETEWSAVMALVEEAFAAFQEFRSSEGGRLHVELSARNGAIQRLLAEVEKLDGGRQERTRQRILDKLTELQADVDQDRFEQELVFYLEKQDVTEEKVRLGSHCLYFQETLDGEEQQGRKLNFISQEMGREINTLGSKANDAAIQRLVVQMKDELEKIKEQALNVL